MTTSPPGLADFAPEALLDEQATRETVRLLSSGGDERIALDPATGLNAYYSGPYPRTVPALASSTANDMSREAFLRVNELARALEGTYAERLQGVRHRIRRAYGLDEDCRIVFAPSGTDLEYVALAAFAEGASIHNILLGADEVGSGCRLSAHGMYFAGTTGSGRTVTPGARVPGLEQVSLVDIPVRCGKGLALDSETIVASIGVEVEAARAHRRRTLVHGVHGSKTGLVLPELGAIDRLMAEHADVSVVIDACQARITRQALRSYLDRGAIVFLTGSKFMGGPPFSGFALVPPRVAERAKPVPGGFVNVFRRAEWPDDWPGCQQLPDEDNPGLWLRLEAAVFELERFQALSPARVERMVDAFQHALATQILVPLGIRLVPSCAPGHESEASVLPIEMRTLATLDISGLPGARTLTEAQGLHKSLAMSGLRLGQPVRSVRTPEGEWGGTIRIGPPMPQFVAWARLPAAELARELDCAMASIATELVRRRVDEAA